MCSGLHGDNTPCRQVAATLPDACCANVQYRKLESRPVFVMAKKRLRRVVQEWQAAAQARKARRCRVTAIQLQATHKVMRRALLSW